MGKGVNSVNPLTWNISIVDPKTGFPSPEFMRKWLQQATANAAQDGANKQNASDISANAAAQAKINANTGFGFFAGGLFKDHELLGAGQFAHAVQFSSGGNNLNADTATAQVAPTSNAIFTFVVNSAVVGQIEFLAGQKVGTITWSPSPYTLAAATQVEVFAPHPADATLAGVAATVYGVKQ